MGFNIWRDVVRVALGDWRKYNVAVVAIDESDARVEGGIGSERLDSVGSDL